MECGETSLSGMGDLELDPDIVSEEAGKLYSELQVTNQNAQLALFTRRIPNVQQPIIMKLLHRQNALLNCTKYSHSIALPSLQKGSELPLKNP